MERLVILMASGHPLTRHDKVPPEALAGQSFVTLGPGFVLTRMAERLAADCGAVVLRGYEGNSMDALRLICALGEGIALVPALYAGQRCDRTKALSSGRWRGSGWTGRWSWRGGRRRRTAGGAVGGGVSGGCLAAGA